MRCVSNQSKGVVDRPLSHSFDLSAEVSEVRLQKGGRPLICAPRCVSTPKGGVGRPLSLSLSPLSHSLTHSFIHLFDLFVSFFLLYFTLLSLFV